VVGIGHQLVGFSLHMKGMRVGVLSSHRAQNAEGRCDGVAVGFDGPARRSCRCRNRSGWEQTTRRQCARCPGRPQESRGSLCRRGAPVEHRLQAAQHPGGPVAVLPDPVDEVGPGQVELLLGHRLALVFEQVSGVRPSTSSSFSRDPLATVAIKAPSTRNEDATQGREGARVTL